MVTVLLYYNSPGLPRVYKILQRNMFIDDKTIQILHSNIANFGIPGKSILNVLIITRRV